MMVSMANVFDEMTRDRPTKKPADDAAFDSDDESFWPTVHQKQRDIIAKGNQEYDKSQDELIDRNEEAKKKGSTASVKTPDGIKLDSETMAKVESPKIVANNMSLFELLEMYEEQMCNAEQSIDFLECNPQLVEETTTVYLQTMIYRQYAMHRETEPDRSKIFPLHKQIVWVDTALLIMALTKRSKEQSLRILRRMLAKRRDLFDSEIERTFEALLARCREPKMLKMFELARDDLGIPRIAPENATNVKAENGRKGGVEKK